MDGVAGVLVLWQIASLVYPMTWSFYCIAQLGWTPGMIGASLAAVGVMIALGQVFVVGPAVTRFGERDAATLGILVAVAVYIAYAFTTSTIGRSEEHTSELQSLMRISSAVFCLKNTHQ